ncbi:MAG: alcohol dehydrogenase catalytic domain-containing protein [Sulfolobales archaeon]
MRAAVIMRPGPPEKAFEIKDLEDPKVLKGHVLVRTRFCSVNHLDLWQRRGSPYFPVEYPRIPGSDAVGVVEEVGENVENIKRGDLVVVAPGWGDGVCTKCLMGRENECENYTILGYTIPGCYAEKILVPATVVYKIREEVDLAELSSIPLTFTTAYHGLVTKAGLGPDESVFIWSSSGGAGIASLKIAKLLNAHVIAHTRSEWKAAILEKLGADEVFVGDYRSAIEKYRSKIDVVVDYIGSSTFNLSIELLRKGGRIVLFGVTSGAEVNVNLRSLYLKKSSIYGVYIGSRWEFEKVLKYYLKGLIKPYIFKIMRIEEVVEAHKILEEGASIGKIVLSY